MTGQPQGYNNDPNFNGQNQHSQQHGANMGPGVHSGQSEHYGGAGTTGNTSIPPTNIAQSGHQQPQSGGGHAMTGKVEHALGTMLGSKSLKAKGLEKEQEAQAFKVQGAELGEAERLEKEALMRRERAVAHGAHPDHRHLGGHNPMAGGANMPAGSNNQAGGFGGGAY